MPLQCYRPFRTTPEVELLGRKTISIEKAAGALSAFLTKSSTLRIQAAAGSSMESSQVSAAQVPDILQSLQQYWVGRDGEARPAECFVEVRGRVEVHLHPFFLGDLARGLHHTADQLLLQYSAPLDCVPLAFLDLKPTGQLGALVGESPWIHFLADFRALGFAPKTGQKLLGNFSNVQTKRGINMTVLGFAHGLVAKADVPAGFRFSAAGDEWLDAQGRRVSELTKVLSFTLTGYNRGERGQGGEHTMLSLSGSNLRRLQLSPSGPVAKKYFYDWAQEAEPDEGDDAIEPSRAASSFSRLPAERQGGFGVKQAASANASAAATSSEGSVAKAKKRHPPENGLAAAAEDAPPKKKKVKLAEEDAVAEEAPPKKKKNKLAEAAGEDVSNHVADKAKKKKFVF